MTFKAKFSRLQNLWSLPFRMFCLRRWAQSRMEIITKFNRQRGSNYFSSPLPSSFSSFSSPLSLIIIVHNKIHHLARGKPGLEDKGKRLKKRMTVLIKSMTYVIWSKSLGFPMACFLHLQVRRFCRSVRCRSGTRARSSLESCPTLCDPIYCNPPGSSVYEISQARILEWVAISFSRGSSRPRDWTCVSCISCIAGGFFTTEPSQIICVKVLLSYGVLSKDELLLLGIQL